MAYRYIDIPSPPQVIGCLVSLLFAQPHFPFSAGTALDHLECFCGDQSVTIGELEDQGLVF